MLRSILKPYIALLLCFFLLLLVISAYATEFPIKVDEAMGRPKISKFKSILGMPGEIEIYMMLSSYDPDKLIAVHAEDAEGFVFMQREKDEKKLSGNGEEKQVPYIRIVPDITNKLEYFGQYILLKGVKHIPKEGKTIPLKLTFETAGDVTVQVKIVNSTAYKK